MLRNYTLRHDSLMWLATFMLMTCCTSALGEVTKYLVYNARRLP